MFRRSHFLYLDLGHSRVVIDDVCPDVSQLRIAPVHRLVRPLLIVKLLDGLDVLVIVRLLDFTHLTP